MAMDLDSCCRLAQDILGVDITPLDGLIQQSAFCTRNQFHPAQTYLLPQQFSRMLDSLPEGEILCLVDLFRVRYLFFRLQDVPVGIGPFCTDFFSLSDCRTLLQQTARTDAAWQLADPGPVRVTVEGEEHRGGFTISYKQPDGQSAGGG